MDDPSLARLRREMEDAVVEATRLMNEGGDLEEVTRLLNSATDLLREITDEEERRKDSPGTVHPFRPRPSNGTPEDGDE